MHSDELRSELRRVTDEAVADGLFGVPSFDVGSRLYFGVDRLPLVVRALGGPAVGHAPVTGGAEGEVIEFFHDVASPYAYLASTQSSALPRAMVRRYAGCPCSSAHCFETSAPLMFRC